MQISLQNKLNKEKKIILRKQSIFIGAFLLTIGGFIAKAIGAFYKIPLTNILGTNGMGIYYLIFPFYSLMLVIVSSGVSVATSKLVSDYRAVCNKENEMKILKTAIIFVLFLSIVFSTLMIVLAKPLSILQGNVNAKLGYLAIAPAIIFASLIAVLRGYFQGTQNMIPTSLSNVLEQAVKLVSGLLLANMFLNYGVEYAVLGAVLGVTISEFFAFIIIVINYIFSARKNCFEKHLSKGTPQTNITYSQAFKKLFLYSVPAMLGSIIVPITGFLDSFMVINILVDSGYSSTIATSLYGINNGIVNTLISLPVIFTVSIATAMVPNLSGLYAKNNEKEVNFKSSFFVKVTWLIALPCFVLFLIFAPDIVRVLYSRGLSSKVLNEFDFAYKLLMLSSVSIIYYAFLQTFTSILQSINKPSIPFISLLIALFIRIALVYVLLPMPNVNIYGVVIANIIFLSVATFINLIYLRRYICFNFHMVRTFIAPITAAIIMGCVMYIVRLSLVEVTSVYFYAILSAILGLGLYIGLIMAFKCFDERERKLFPNIKRITKRKHRI